MSRFSALMRTTAARLSALYLLLFAVGAVALVFYMTNLSASILAGQTQQALGEEVASIGKSYARGGIPQLVRTIDYRSRQPGAYLYLVADPTGRILAGNVESVEPGVLNTDGIIERAFTYRRYGEQAPQMEHRAIAVVIALPNGMRLLVGRDLGEPERFRDLIRNSLVLALGIMGVGALLIWLFVGRRALKRIDDVSRASQRIMDGDLTGRLPVNGSGDEFDRLSGNLNVMLARILELNEGLKQVSDNIAHDLKTPLTRLRNRAEEALGGEKVEPEYRAALEDIIGESDQLIRTFNAILMISRLEAGYSSENLDDMPVAPIMRDVAEMYEPVAEDAGVTLTLGALDDVALHINRELVGQTVSNLVDNAIKYAGGEGRTATVTLLMEKDAQWVRIVVADNGPGIPADKRDHATERFVRLEESRTQPGSGLGLSLAKSVMKLHGGALRLEDNGPGLRAVLEFPLPHREVG
ncbi:two-component sensor histidine kinase [Brucella melitensis]|uniref:histidine kinase n=3 Tax=Brucella melitensis TaxID=29459 RepID=C0RHV9_BRUMB|nr:sensory transduction histidine kinase [Brucella melitensis bv. 1 str. 16M]ACO00417.1 integral membrane sensor signal transduction histidine kinase [Brucella melitensis ATCC 23457]AIJ84841.1 HAMP domain protein [Brucella melitensis bv. 3 str. Ether]AIJ95543.1 HAMP domain protein [Brucella melitensis bv. 2 str. 63/9]AOG49420.1 two-component sensor histidine kinase [Brucella melitensis]EEZ14086.1 integral membrane sensor signal transduction histidine kinase [Brucella melitensis bv. 1 str. Rev.